MYNIGNVSPKLIDRVSFALIDRVSELLVTQMKFEELKFMFIHRSHDFELF
jgi:hypothetical protein